MNRMELMEWVQKVWKLLFDFSSQVIGLPKGWFSFIFLTEEHTEQALDRFRVIKEGLLILLRWNVHFDSYKRNLSKRHLWLLLPGLPVQF